jgi:hypothetical protein
VISDTGEEGLDTVLFNINQFGADPALDLGDIYFSVDEHAIFEGGDFAITTGAGASTSNILIENMYDGDDWAVEHLTIDFGDKSINFDLTEIYDLVTAYDDQTASLADLLNADSDATFDALASALEDAVTGSDGSAEGIANAAPVETEFVNFVKDDQSDDYFNVQGNG